MAIINTELEDRALTNDGVVESPLRAVVIVFSTCGVGPRSVAVADDVVKASTTPTIAGMTIDVSTTQYNSTVFRPVGKHDRDLMKYVSSFKVVFTLYIFYIYILQQHVDCRSSYAIRD